MSDAGLVDRQVVRQLRRVHGPLARERMPVDVAVVAEPLEVEVRLVSAERNANPAGKPLNFL